MIHVPAFKSLFTEGLLLSPRMSNALYYGDNLGVLRNSIASESVDLIYLDPPFNSSTSYNVLFKAPSGEGSQAQIEAFEVGCTGSVKTGVEAEARQDFPCRASEPDDADAHASLHAAEKGFFKKFENHMNMVALYSVWQFRKQHKNLNLYLSKSRRQFST